ncbi:MAG: hypothetical protein II022_01620, partial [Muribaculaceae bacterium]|nr:hypothetical protein [Muribaculaceae bacterium]
MRIGKVAHSQQHSCEKKWQKSIAMHKFPANFAKNHEVCKDFALSFFSVEQLVFVIPFLIIALWAT